MRIYLLLFFLSGLLFQAQAQTSLETDSIYSVPDVQPEFPGGDQAFLLFISNHIIYPEDAKNQELEGKVVAQYVIEKNGSLSNIKIVEGKGLSPSCDKAVIDALLKSPRWKPGIKNGKPVRVKRYSRVNFGLQY